METFQRRRVVFATALTLVAFPSIWLVGRDDPTVAPNLAVAGVPTPQPDQVDTDDTLAPEVPVFLENTLVVPPPLLDTAATPTSSPLTTIAGSASYLQFEDPAITCTSPRAPGGATITVTNVDNGRSVTCSNQLGITIPYGIDVALAAGVFVQIADLADAPVPVRVSW